MSLDRLETQHRVEEVLERFRLAGDVGPDAIRLPLSRLSKRAAESAAAHGLVVEGEHVVLGLDQPPRDLEDRLIGWLGGLLEADPAAFFTRPPRAIQTPASGDLPQSARWLERFYGSGFLPREKKPIVVDLERCQGPYLRSVDDDPIQIIDSASQIASHVAGLRPGPVQAAVDDGRMGPLMLSAAAPDDVARGYAEHLLGFRLPHLGYVTWTGGGSEAVEKALHLARRMGGGGRRVIGFEGSFHGRTLLSLFSTWNPVKRAPYQLEGFETRFAPFPVAEVGADPPAPAGWREAWGDRDGKRDFGGDPTLDAEVASLRAVEEQLRSRDALAVIIEPYQCEGGDRGATSRFYNGLRALTRAFGKPLIFDEVQAGFGLSGQFFWHRRFWLTDALGRPDGPDLVVCAKRAQVGLVISRWPDAYPTPAHGASLLRGHIHAQMAWPAQPHTTHVLARLNALARALPEGLVTRIRATGDAFAFDMPSGAIANKVIAQRFYRGMMVYIAGERTLRYRMNRAMTEDDVDTIVGAIQAAIEALISWAGGPGDDLLERLEAAVVPDWVEVADDEAIPVALPTLQSLLGQPNATVADRYLRAHGELSDSERHGGEAVLGLSGARGEGWLGVLRQADAEAFEREAGISLLHFAADALGTRIRRLPPEELVARRSDIVQLENDAYEPARQDPIAYLRTVAESEGGFLLVAEDPRGLVGMSFAGPLELWWGLDGPRQDPRLGHGDTLYSADITVANRARNRGIGLRLRIRQVQEALAARRPDGQPRYAFITGRNRVGEAAAMWAINRRLGAYTVAIYDGQYGETTGQARYYRLPLRRWDRRPFSTLPAEPPVTDLSGGVAAPTGPAHPLLVRARDLGVFDEAAATKLTVSNFITRPYARYAELMRAVAPRGTAHMYFTRTPDELVDKTIRVLKHQRTGGRIAVGITGGYAGHTTAAARSLTDWDAYHGGDGPAWQRPDEGFFGWPRVPHPAGGADATIQALDALVEQHGAETLLGVFVESCQARTGQVLGAEAWAALCAFRDRTGVPLVLSESTTGLYRSGRGMWWLDGVEGDPDVVTWWAGGQIGHLFASDRVFVDKPLAFISTWDGDELSATRLMWQLHAARRAPVAARIQQLEEGLERAGWLEATRGVGLYRVIETDRRDDLVRRFMHAGLRVDPLGAGRLLVAPPVTVDGRDLDRLLQVLDEVRR